MDKRIQQIRESEKKSHIEMYSNEKLYKSDSWLKKPIKTIREITPLFKEYNKLNVLDLGCGVGRNSIYVAQEYKNIDCVVECVDILEIAIEKLNANAAEYQVSSNVRGIVKTIENYSIQADNYDLIIAVSALEHIDSKSSFVNKMVEIRDGVRKEGIVCLVINSEVREKDKVTGEELPAQFEVNLPTAELQKILNKEFEGWAILKSTVSNQQYDIPRENRISDLQSNVVTFVARKCFQSFPERLARKVIYESDWVSLYADKVKMPNGYIIDTYHKLHYPHESVSVVIVNEKEEILMIQSKRYVTERLEWEIPAGRIEKDESPADAAVRECLEETGCTIKDLTFLCCHNPSNGMSDLKLHVFGAKVKTETVVIDENEVNAKSWIPKDRVLEMLRENQTHCGVSMLALLYAIQFYI